MTDLLKTPRAIIVQGPGLEKMHPAEYAQFVERLGRMGMAVTTAMLDEFDGDKLMDPAAFERYVRGHLRFADEQDLRSFAQKTNDKPMVTKTWNALTALGKYFPLSPGAVTQASHVHNHSVFYYPKDLLTDDFRDKSYDLGIDPELGFTVGDAIRYPALAPACTRLRRSAKIEMHSVQRIVTNNVLADTPGVGQGIVGIAEAFGHYMLNTAEPTEPPTLNR